jgi:hypothetical protein
VIHELADLVAGVDIADLLEVSPPAVANWRNRYADFPQPILIVGRGNLPLFSLVQVLTWAALNDKLPAQKG